MVQVIDEPIRKCKVGRNSDTWLALMITIFTATPNYKRFSTVKDLLDQHLHRTLNPAANAKAGVA